MHQAARFVCNERRARDFINSNSESKGTRSFPKGVLVEGCGQVLGAMAVRCGAKGGLRNVVSGLQRGVERLSVFG